MYQGGPSYTQKSASIIRYAGLVVPIVLVLFGLAIQTGQLESPHGTDSMAFLYMTFWWVYLGVLQFLSPSKTKLTSALKLVAYHLLGSGFLLFVSGLSSPLVAFWIILLIASNTYFSRTGIRWSLLWFLVTILLDIYIWRGFESMSVLTYNAISLVAVTLSGVVILGISRAQEVDRNELANSREKESLQRDRILTIVNNLSSAVISTNSEGTINVYNAASLNLIDTNESLSGKNIDELLNLTDTDDKPIKLADEFKKSKDAITRDDIQYKIDKEEKIRLEITYSPIRSSYSKTKNAETHDGYILIMKDVTKSKSLEEERDEFISVVSHELRTPITVVEGNISNVQIMMKHGDATKEMLKDAVDAAHEQIVYLASMVNDLSTLSRAERGVSDKPEEIDVKEMVHALHEEYHKQAAEKKLHLDLNLGATIGHVYTSRLYLEEMLQNFITNAIKYTKEGSVTISVKQKLDVITFSIKDTGIGISKSDQAKIFHKFYRSEDYRTRETSGNGLGLYIAAKLAHKVNTKIELESRLNHGSTFSFKLPVYHKKKKPHHS